MTEYDIGAAFKAIEDELISSMIRNMDRHRAEEDAEGLNWSMWQAEQLKALEKYKVQNQKKYQKQFNSINAQIGEIIRTARSTGNMSQEVAILQAIKDGFKGTNKVSRGATAEFFRLNDRKLDALIKATTDDMKKAETAVLRMANDQYRKAIFNAQVYANSGAGTYEKAVDMATKDMLSSGLNCVEYKNGARHTLADYADMAIRTASKRAHLQGEGEKRQEWGIATVIINKRGNPCPKCLPFCGKVLIDDVWSGGKKTDGSYPLMSATISAGLYHPRCKDSHTTYFEGISTPPEGKWTEEELQAIGQSNTAEARRRYAERQAEKFGRLGAYSLDGQNRKIYRQKAEAWEDKTGRRYTITDDMRKHREDVPDNMADLIDKYTSDEFVIIDELAGEAFAYDFDADAVVVNPKHTSYEWYDYQRVMIHEIAHRIDRNEFSSPMNNEFYNTLSNLSDRIKNNKAHFIKIFAPGSEMEYNELISDIFSMLTDNEVAGPFGHSLDYIQQFGNRELEVFADVFTILYTGQDNEVEFIKRELPELYETFVQLIGGT